MILILNLNLEEFNDDFEKIIEKTLQENVWLVNVGADKKSSQKAVFLAEKYEKGVYAPVGIHPISLFPAINEKLKREVDSNCLDKDNFYNKELYKKLI